MAGIQTPANDVLKTDVADAAQLLIATICTHRGTNGVTDFCTLSDEVAKNLFILLEVAGFEVDEVISGRVGRIGGDDVNKLCPYKVVSNGRDHVFVTGWLDAMVRLVASGCANLPMSEEAHEILVAKVHDEIARSQPLKPIRLTLTGQELVENPPQPQNGNYLVDHTRDETPLLAPNDGGVLPVGVHRRCRGRIYRHCGSELSDALVCSTCHLRVEFPRETATFGRLRANLNVSRRFEALCHHHH